MLYLSLKYGMSMVIYYFMQKSYSVANLSSLENICILHNILLYYSANFYRKNKPEVFENLEKIPNFFTTIAAPQMAQVILVF
jgi:hypothetical protein